jgi:hypothetical protein
MHQRSSEGARYNVLIVQISYLASRSNPRALSEEGEGPPSGLSTARRHRPVIPPTGRHIITKLGGHLLLGGAALARQSGAAANPLSRSLTIEPAGSQPGMTASCRSWGRAWSYDLSRWRTERVRRMPAQRVQAGIRGQRAEPAEQKERLALR